MTADPEIILKKKLLDRTISDCKLIDANYEKINLLMSELDDHRLNGRWTDYDKTVNDIMKLNTEITDTENRCRTRLGLSKL